MAQRLAVLASGGGSNFRAILHAIGTGILPLTCPLLISNTPRAGALRIARDHGCTAVVLDSSGDGHANALLKLLKKHRIDLIALAGYLKKVPPVVVAAYRHRMLNIHPALLPDFGGAGYYGMRVHAAVLASGAQQSGATVHFVDNEYDTGPILLQDRVPVMPDDTPAKLAKRVLALEHRLYPQALQLLAQGLVRIDGRQVFIHNELRDQATN